VSCTQVFEWHALFRASWTSIEDDRHTGRLISSTTLATVTRLQELVHEDRLRTIQNLADEIRNAYVTCQWILTAEPGIHCYHKFLPRILTADQKQ
jgi:hypothetical protein